MHLGNENVSILAVATIAGVADVFLAGVYILTRRLWLAIGATAAVYVVWRAHDQGMFVRPLWRSEDRGVGTGSVLPELR